MQESLPRPHTSRKRMGLVVPGARVGCSSLVAAASSCVRYPIPIRNVAAPTHPASAPGSCASMREAQNERMYILHAAWRRILHISSSICARCASDAVSARIYRDSSLVLRDERGASHRP